MESEQTHPLLLPEFIHELGFYLEKDVLFDCIQVSKLWYRTFLPRLWGSISVDDEDTETEKDAARTFHYIEKNAAMIESLDLFNLKEDCANKLLKLEYPLLETLSLKFTEYQDILPAMRDMLIRHGPRLSSLNFRYVVRDESVFQLFDVLEGCKDHGRLRCLFLGLMIVDVSAMDTRSRQLLWSLDTLEIDCVSVMHCNQEYWEKQGRQPPALSPGSMSIMSGNSTKKGTGKDNVPSKVRDLTVVGARNSLKVDYEHFLACQELKSLSWVERGSSYSHKPIMADDLQRGLWPSLDSLCLGLKHLSDRDIANIILALGDRPMKLLELNGTAFGPLSASALVYGKIIDGENNSKPMPDEMPRPTLQMLYVRNTKCEGIWMQRFLCLYSNLKRFAGTFMTDRDLTDDPRPWTCLKLEHLNLDIRREVYDGLEPELLEVDDDETLFVNPPSIFLDRIATLTRMEELLLSQKKFSNDDFQNLELHWTLTGIKALKSLTRLMTVYWFEVEYMDAIFIEETWPCLTTIVTRMTDEEARVYLHDNGIEVEDSDEPVSDESNPMADMFNAILGNPFF